MNKKIIFVGVLVAAVLGLAKTQHWFERSGVISRCEVAAAPFGEQSGGQWWSCREGILTGYPTLERDSCQSKGFANRRELWYCPTPLASTPGF